MGTDLKVRYGGTVHVYAPDTFWQRTIEHCPTCKRRRRFVVMHQIWYDPTATCCGCGDSWTSGYRDARPFARGWRDTAVRRARQRWTVAGNREQLRAWVRGELAPEIGPSIITTPDLSTWKVPDAT